VTQSAITHEMVVVTPRMAADWLEAVRNVTKLDTRLLESYKRDMMAGAWKINGDPLIFDEEGCLLDGRLRLHACCDSLTSFETLVIRGIDPKNFITIDALRRRTASDIMHIRGEPSGRALAAGLTFLWRAGLGDLKKQARKISSPELIELLDKNASVRRSLGIAKRVSPTIPHGLGTALHYLFQNEERTKADRFFAEFADNAEQPSDAVFALRRALDNILDEGGKRSPLLITALAFKAWAAYKEGRDVKLLRFLPDTEDFPSTPGLDGLEMPENSSDRGSLLLAGGTPIASSTPSIDVKIKVQNVTPIVASEILNRNDKNRKIAAGIVKKYVRDMQGGNWALNGQTIKIGRSGRLLDGQHRLTASVMSGHSFMAIVVEGLDDDVFDTFDVGNKRALADILSDMNEVNTALLAGAVRQLWQLENGLVKIRTATPSVNELLDTLERHPCIRTSVSLGNNFRRLGSPSQLAALHYCFTKSDAQMAEVFIEKLVHGDELKRGSPILALRDILIEDRNNPKRKMGAPERIAITIKGWNAYKNSVDVKWLRWSPDREAFPQIIGCTFEEASDAQAE
jgi:hypothetical protein